jgi:regulatory protein
MVLKLREKGFPADVVTEVISFLKEAGMLDDARFARQWARCRREYRYFGPIRLKGELLKKGISPADIDQVLNEFSEEWDPEMLAEQALIQRFKEPAALQNLKVRQRAFAFLQRKGFSTETIFKVFKRWKTK